MNAPLHCARCPRAATAGRLCAECLQRSRDWNRKYVASRSEARKQGRGDLATACVRCAAPPGNFCTSETGRPCRPHRERLGSVPRRVADSQLARYQRPELRTPCPKCHAAAYHYCQTAQGRPCRTHNERTGTTRQQRYAAKTKARLCTRCDVELDKEPRTICDACAIRCSATARSNRAKKAKEHPVCQHPQ